MQSTSPEALVLLDKPPGPSSFAAVRAVSRVLGTRRVGHTGTLDPFASGLLIILVGRATRLAAHVPDEPKVYRAAISFGVETTTGDPEGEVIAEAPPPDHAGVPRAVEALTGSIVQVPPAFSARKVAGERAYALARRGEVPALQPSQVRVDGWDVLGWQGTVMTARITCGRGVYVRALARDLGRALGSAAHLAALRRERAGPFSVDEATTWDELVAGSLRTRPAIEALGEISVCTLTPADLRKAAHGARIPASGEGLRAALVREGGELVAIARREGDFWRPDVVMVSE